MKRGRSLWAGAALIALAIALGSIPAQAGRSPAAVQAATGCLTTRHKWVKVALGDNPSSACSVDQTQLQLAGGDITSVSAGSGLSGGGTSGDLTLNSTIHLNQGPDVSVPPHSTGTAFAGCADNEVAIAGGVRWDSVSSLTTVLLAGPSFRGDGSVGSWRVDGFNDTASTRTLVAYVTCITK